MGNPRVSLTISFSKHCPAWLATTAAPRIPLERLQQLPSNRGLIVAKVCLLVAMAAPIRVPLRGDAYAKAIKSVFDEHCPSATGQVFQVQLVPHDAEPDAAGVMVTLGRDDLYVKMIGDYTLPQQNLNYDHMTRGDIDLTQLDAGALMHHNDRRSWVVCVVLAEAARFQIARNHIAALLKTGRKCLDTEKHLLNIFRNAWTRGEHVTNFTLFQNGYLDDDGLREGAKLERQWADQSMQ